MARPRALSPGGCWPLPPAFRRPPPPECRDACACLQTGCDGRARAGRRFRARRKPLQPTAGTCARGIPPCAEGSPAGPRRHAGRSSPMPQAAAGGGGMASLPPAPATVAGTQGSQRGCADCGAAPLPRRSRRRATRHPPTASTRRCSRPRPRPGNPLGTNRSWACACRRRTGCRIPTATGCTSSSIDSRCAPRPRRRVFGRMNPTCWPTRPRACGPRRRWSPTSPAAPTTPCMPPPWRRRKHHTGAPDHRAAGEAGIVDRCDSAACVGIALDAAPLKVAVKRHARDTVRLRTA